MNNNENAITHQPCDAVVVQPVPNEDTPIQVCNSVEDIAFAIKKQMSRIEESFLDIGNLLIQAKAKLNHGQWLKWVRNNVEISNVTVQRLMYLAREFSNTSPVTHLGFSKTYALLSLPEDDRIPFIETPHTVDGVEKKVSEMSKREIEVLIREKTKKPKKNEHYNFKTNSKFLIEHGVSKSPSTEFNKNFNAAYGNICEIFDVLADLSNSPGLCKDLASKLHTLSKSINNALKMAEIIRE
ncbi:MAG: DUF3102 domain-containing protein [Defluviitaleaceae bacterium]|nr:DUF3102 domain-containing protein [Defluviitaleaceae bacterium]